MPLRQPRVRHRVTPAALDQVFQHQARAVEVVVVGAVHHGDRAHEQGVAFQRGQGMVFRAIEFASHHGAADGSDNAREQIVIGCEQPVDCAFQVVGPDDSPAGGLGQLHKQAHLLPHYPAAPRQHIGCAQVPPDVFQRVAVFRPVAKNRRRKPRDHVQLCGSAQCRNEFIGDRLADEGMLRIHASGRKWNDRNRGPQIQRNRVAGLNHRRVPWRPDAISANGFVHVFEMAIAQILYIDIQPNRQLIPHVGRHNNFARSRQRGDAGRQVDIRSVNVLLVRNEIRHVRTNTQMHLTFRS